MPNVKRRYHRYLREESDEDESYTVGIPRTTLNRWKRRRLTLAIPILRLTDHESDEDNTNVQEDRTDEDRSSESDSNISSLGRSLDDVDNNDDDSDGYIFDEPRQDANDDNWLNLPIYEDSEDTVGSTVKRVLEYYLVNSLTKKSLEELLQLLTTLLPQPNHIPKTKFLLSKLLNSLMPSHNQAIRKHRFCNTCSHYLGDWFANPVVLMCDLCHSTNVNGMFIEYDIRSLLIDAFEVRNLHSYIDMHTQSKNCDNDFICDLTDGSGFKSLRENAIDGKYDLCLLWNVDGIPTANSSSGQLWPIQLQILNIPPKHRRNFQFVSGLWYSSVSKPNMNSFLKPFTVAMKDLYTNGIDWHYKPTGLTVNSKVVAPIATLDCPARAAVQNLMQFNGMYGCSFCEHPGETCRTGVGINHVYRVLTNDPPLRTNDVMLIQASSAVNNDLNHVKGVKGPTIVSKLPFFDVAVGFVPDYMHAILLGVVRMLIGCWCDTKNKHKPFYIRKSLRDEIDDALKQIKPPDTITRTPRPLKYRQYWKASELKAFLLFYSAILLKGILPTVYYQHYLLLVRATYILLQSRIHTNEIDLAESLFYLFVAEIENLYGLEKCSFNVHQLTHMASSVRLWGPLWAWSAFSFEDGNGYLLKIAHGPNKIDAEIFNTLKIVNAFQILKQKLSSAMVNLTPVTLGLSINQSLNNDEISALSNASGLHIDDSLPHIYARVKIGNEIFTSSLYQRQQKRDNSFISWSNGAMFGLIKMFVVIDLTVYALVQEYAEQTEKRFSIYHKDLEMTFNSYLKPFRRTYCMHAIPAIAIEGKLLRVINYACMLPNLLELK